MNYLVYVDLTLNSPSPEGLWDAHSVTLRQVHSASARQGVPFVSAYPKWMGKGFTLGNVLRVWVRSKDEAERLMDDFETIPRVQEFVTVGRIRQVENPTRWEAYVKAPYGIKGARLNDPDPAVREATARRRLQRLAEMAHLPSIGMKSSSANRFRLAVDRRVFSDPQNGTPNGYGFSSGKNIVTVPIVD